MTFPKKKQIIGSSLLGYRKFIKKKWGKAGVEDVEKFINFKLDDVTDEKWYPSILNDSMLAWIAQNYGMDMVRQAGFYIVTNVGIVSFAARIAGIERVFTRGMEQFRNNIDYGEINIEKEGKVAMITMIDVSVDEVTHMAWQGIFEGVLHVSGARGTVTVLETQTGGSDKCVYKMEWK